MSIISKRQFAHVNGSCKPPEPDTKHHLSLYALILKRGVDCVIAVLLLALLAPVLVVISMLIWLLDGKPILFKQERPGRQGACFRLYKFRTMRNTCRHRESPRPDSERLTPLGRALRALSLDELPQLWNVLKGDMSLIGPRPLLGRYLPYLTALENTRHLVRPGITGLAQVSGRNTVDWDTRLSLDVMYVENVSASLDLKIACLTVIKVLWRADVVVDPTSVMLDLDEERRDKKANGRAASVA